MPYLPYKFEHTPPTSPIFYMYTACYAYQQDKITLPLYAYSLFVKDLNGELNKAFQAISKVTSEKIAQEIQALLPPVNEQLLPNLEHGATLIPISQRANIEEVQKDGIPADDALNKPYYYTNECDEETSRIDNLVAMEMRFLQDTELTPHHFILAILRDQNNLVGQIFAHHGITHKKYKDYLLQANKSSTENDEQPQPHGTQDELEKSAVNSGRQTGQSHRSSKNSKSETPLLDEFGNDLTEVARRGWLDPIVGRECEIERMAQILSRRKKNNPILIGEPGVGKSALVEGLAQLIVANKVPHLLQNKRIVTIDLSILVAGTQYRGQFEERLQEIIKELKVHPEIIIFIDEIHTIIGAGSTPGTMDAANILKPALARGEVQCIGATTIGEYKKSIEKDGALERRFQKIMLAPSTPEESLQILHNLKERYEQHHHVSYTTRALEACVQLTDRYVTDRAFPDKAIDAMDEAGSRANLLYVQPPTAIKELEERIAQLRLAKEQAAQEQAYEKAANLRDEIEKNDLLLQAERERWQADLNLSPIVVDDEDIAQVVSMMSSIPVEKVGEDESLRLKGLKEHLQKHVIAQDRAIARVTRAITRNRIGLKDPNRPVGVFMFVGPTGVGKTHLVKALAEQMFGTKDALIRLDMSEYQDKWNVSRLVGSSPGYIGYEEGGQLTEKVRRSPYSIVLLDEIEKAHPDVFNVFLQVMDEGRLTDGQGVTIDFRNTIIIMTSNTGSRQIKEFGVGVGFAAANKGIDAQTTEGIVRKALQKQFAPEFLNRIDEIVMFNPLQREDIVQIAQLEMQALATRMGQMNLQVHITAEAEQFIAQKAYDPQYGARSLRRTIQEYIEDPICDLFLEGKILSTVHIDRHAENDRLDIRSLDTENDTHDHN